MQHDSSEYPVDYAKQDNPQNPFEVHVLSPVGVLPVALYIKKPE
jgi:hypothetical protein